MRLSLYDSVYIQDLDKFLLTYGVSLQYLDEVVMVAREAHKDISKRSVEDEVIVDTRPASNTRQMLQQ